MLIFFLLTLGYKEFFEKKSFLRFSSIWPSVTLYFNYHYCKECFKASKMYKIEIMLFFWTRVLRIFHTTSKEGKEQFCLLEKVYTRDSFVWQTKYLKIKNTAQIMAFIKNKGGIIFPRLSVVWLPLLWERYTKIDNL